MADKLVALLRQKDGQGLKLLQIHYGALIRYVIAPILPVPQDQEDCINEIYLRVWEHMEDFDERKGSLKVWITAISRNTALNHARKIRLTTPLEDASDLPSPHPTPEELVLLEERRSTLMHALRSLNRHELTLFYRKYYYLQSTAQIASEMGMTLRSVEGQLYRIKKKLRKLIGGEWNA